MQTVSTDVCNERHKALEQYLNPLKANISKLDPQIKDIQEAIIVLTTIQARHDENLEDHETRIRGIEAVPGKRWDNIVSQIIQLIAAASLGSFLAQLFNS